VIVKIIDAYMTDSNLIKLCPTQFRGIALNLPPEFPNQKRIERL